MLFSNKMTLILVVWQVASLVRSEHDTFATHEGSRRTQLKIRMLERLAERGLEAAERELAAEELLARLDAHTTTEFPFFRLPQPPRRRSSLSPRLEEAAMRLALAPPEAEVPPFVQLFPGGSSSDGGEGGEGGEADLEAIEAAEEERGAREDLERLRKYLQDEVAHDRREVESASLAKAAPDASRQRRVQRSHRRREKKKKRDSKKKKREDKKKRNRKRDREYRRLLERDDVLITTEDGEQFYDCCPSKLVVKEIKVGKSRENYAMEISASHQLFYERVCLEGYEGKECVFPPRSLKRNVTTRCHQEYSLTQAIARPYESDEDYKLDYIKIRSGCSCQISVPQKKKKRKRKR
ncbi:uncharacterized protein LOC122260340 [Penaeus japonicus]|uniref:uncharacterized protein LOC122260340 n=1 Tax=Penaeus japonicus TaxID=27405 RepID=UPI001C714427|nr:uncharacterized protein LOC122260340 [Penaeus japonicus]